MTMSSASATCPCAILPVYGSTKSFVLQLSQSLQNAYPTSETGLVFHAFHPFFIKTTMTTKDGVDPIEFLQSYFFPTGDKWMECALKVYYFSKITR